MSVSRAKLMRADHHPSRAARPFVVPLVIAGTIRVLAAASQMPVAGHQTAASSDRDAIDPAAAIWEQAIVANGGRDRLRSIRNFVVESHEIFSRSTRPDVATHEDIQRLYVLDGKMWEFADYRPGLMGASGLILDIRRHLAWGSSGREEPRAFPDLMYRFVEGQYLYLMETGGGRPKPISVRSERLRGADVDIVATRIGDLRVDFALDRRSYLPVRIVTQRPPRSGRSPSPRVFRLSNYGAIDGIQMPANVHFGDDEVDTTTTSYQFNVEYDEAIFEPKTTRFETSAWKKKP